MLYNSQKNLANIEMITASWYVIANTAAAVRQKSVVKGIAVHHLTPNLDSVPRLGCTIRGKPVPWKPLVAANIGANIYFTGLANLLR